MKIAANITDDFIMVKTDSTLTLTLPAGLKKDEFTSIMAEVKSIDQVRRHMMSRRKSDALRQTNWGVKITLPTYTDGVCDEGTAKVKVTAPKALSLDNETAMLIVTLSKKGGTTLTTSRTLTSPDRYNSIGNGTAASPYLIYNALQLQSLATAVNAGNPMTDSCFRMESDIDLSGVCHKVDGTPENDVSWTTDWRICWNNNCILFNGTFDGNGHKIINLYINQTGT
jgi:hypothetical protein